MSTNSKSPSQFGDQINMITFGESHGKAVGCVIDNVQPGVPISIEEIQKELDRRKPGQSKVVTSRKEADKVEILSGIFEGKTTGAPICMIVYNTGQRPQDYDYLIDVFRPGHADFTFFKKFGCRDHRGGGRSSGRETIARVASGSIAKQALAAQNIHFWAYVKQIGSIRGSKVNKDFVEQNPFRVADPDLVVPLEKLIASIRAEKNSIGGIVRLTITGLPVGLGDPVFEKIDANLTKGIMSIGAVKGVVFGDFLDYLPSIPKGSEVNDQMNAKGFCSNHMGGVLGGISNGQNIEIDILVKPTPSIAQKQKTINTNGDEVSIEIKGRHDPCICPRIVPVIENMAALVIWDSLLNLK